MSHLHKPLYFVVLLAAFVGGVGELAMLQGWRLRDRVRRWRVQN